MCMCGPVSGVTGIPLLYDEVPYYYGKGGGLFLIVVTPPLSVSFALLDFV